MQKLDIDIIDNDSIMVNANATIIARLTSKVPDDEDVVELGRKAQDHRSLAAEPLVLYLLRTLISTSIY